MFFSINFTWDLICFFVVDRKETRFVDNVWALLVHSFYNVPNKNHIFVVGSSVVLKIRRSLIFLDVKLSSCVYCH